MKQFQTLRIYTNVLKEVEQILSIYKINYTIGQMFNIEILTEIHIHFYASNELTSKINDTIKLVCYDYKPNEEDKKLLTFIFFRLKDEYNEDVKTDYMLNLNKLIRKIN